MAATQHAGGLPMARTAPGFRLYHDGPSMMTVCRSNGCDLSFRSLRLCSRFCSQPSTVGLASNFHSWTEGRRMPPDSNFRKDNAGNDLKQTHFSAAPADGVGA